MASIVYYPFPFDTHVVVLSVGLGVHLVCDLVIIYILLCHHHSLAFPWNPKIAIIMAFPCFMLHTHDPIAPSILQRLHYFSPFIIAQGDCHQCCNPPSVPSSIIHSLINLVIHWTLILFLSWLSILGVFPPR